ncbi:MAG TPA: hypothetical protein VJH22_06540 [Candidatus Nanoarchaeia archaeon]|nr:hypothetical protein [Candidatus Nanoarchaeia archaeon]
MVFTEHNTVEVGTSVDVLATPDFRVFRGCEYSSADGHVLVGLVQMNFCESLNDPFAGSPMSRKERIGPSS